MTTSEPQTGNRSIGQRIRDAVLGDPVDERPGAPTDARDEAYADPDSAVEADSGLTGTPAAHTADTADTRTAETRADLDRGDPVDAPRDVAPDATGGEYGGYERAMQEHVDRGAVPDPVRDDVAQDGTHRGAAGLSDAEVRDAGLDTGGAGLSESEVRDAGLQGSAVQEPPVQETAVQDSAVHEPLTTEHESRDYRPATDTAYVEEGQMANDQSTTFRDADYDTGRVDTDRDRGAVADDSGLGDGLGEPGLSRSETAGTTTAAGADRDDRGFSEVDDTSTVEPTTTGGMTADPAATATTGTTSEATADRAETDRAATVAGESGGAGTAAGEERLVPVARAQEYSSRWDALKGDFVDEPERAVARADELVGELLDEIQRMFTDQRNELEQGFDHDSASTEDLRLALRRYRSFFDRLLSF